MAKRKILLTMDGNTVDITRTSILCPSVRDLENSIMALADLLEKATGTKSNIILTKLAFEMIK